MRAKTLSRVTRAKVTDEKLKAYLEADKYPTVLIGAVDKYLQRQPSDRDASVIHPSEMAAEDWCPRATWHRLEGRAAKTSPVNLRANLIFAEGHDIHKKWQGWLKDMGILWGKWQCISCEQIDFAWADSLESGNCPANGGKHLWRYKEVPLESPMHNVKGHADGIVNPTYEEPILLEVKSVGPGTIRGLGLLPDHIADELSGDSFSRINHPAKSHFRQTQIYLRLSEQYAPVVGPVRRGLIVYEHKADQQVREFVIERNDDWTDPLFEMAADIMWAIGKGRQVACRFGYSGCARCRAYEEA